MWLLISRQFTYLDQLRVCMKSLKFVYGRCSLNLLFIFHESNLSKTAFGNPPLCGDIIAVQSPRGKVYSIVRQVAGQNDIDFPSSLRVQPRSPLQN